MVGFREEPSRGEIREVSMKDVIPERALEEWIGFCRMNEGVMVEGLNKNMEAGEVNKPSWQES